MNPAACRSVFPRVKASDSDAGWPHGLGNKVLDFIPTMACEENKVSEALAGVELHDMPHHRAAANLDKWLGKRLSTCLQACASTPAEDDHCWQF